MRKKRKFPFTRRALETLPPHDPKKSGGNGTEYSDAGCCGLRAIAGPSGRIHLMFRYTYLSRKRAMALGEWPAVSIEAARKKVYTYRAMLAEGRDPKVERDEDKQVLTYREYLQIYLDQHSKVRKKTWREDELKITRILNPAVGNLRLDNITTRDISNLHNSERVRTSPTSANHVVRLISSTLNVAVALGYLDKAKLPTMPKKFPERKRECYLSLEQVAKFVKAADNHDVRGCGDAVKLLLFTGCRKMEILGLKWENVKFDEQTLYLPDTKNGRSRNILLNSMALAVLEKRKSEWNGKNPYVFPAPTPDSKVPHLQEVRKTFRGACQEAGISWQQFPLHGLRHTYASLVVSNGGTLYEAQQLLGHLDQTTTQRYAHLASDSLRRATNKVSDKIAQALA
jgi:integrase